MGIVVLGMHRSGTSAITNALFDMGYARPIDLMQGGADNEEGHAESTAVTGVDDMVLERFGGSWHSPPLISTNWDDVRDLEPLAVSVFEASFRSRPWAWKDPRTCVLLPFWRRVLTFEPLRAVFIFRHPADVAASLAGEDRQWERITYRPFAFALWERHNRCVINSLTNEDAVLPTDYDRLVEDLDYQTRWSACLTDFVSGDVALGADEVSRRVRARIKHEQRHERGSDDADLLDEQRSLHRQLQSMAENFRVNLQVPAETTRTTALLAEHRACPREPACQHRTGF